MLLEYIRDNNNNPMGAVVCTGLDRNGRPMIGWSARSPQEKSYSKKIARQVAIGRTLSEEETGVALIVKLEQKGKFALLDGMTQKAERFFKLAGICEKMVNRAYRYYYR